LRKRAETCPGVSLCAERFRDSPSGVIVTFHDTKRSFDVVESSRVLRSERRLYSDRIGNSSNTWVMVKCNVVEWTDVTRLQREVFNDSTNCVLLYMPSPGAKRRPPNESTLARTDDVLVLLGIDRTYDDPPLREYPCTIRQFHPNQVSLTQKTNQSPCASHRSWRSRNAVGANSVEDGGD